MAQVLGTDPFSGPRLAGQEVAIPRYIPTSSETVIKESTNPFSGVTSLERERIVDPIYDPRYPSYNVPFSEPTYPGQVRYEEGAGLTTPPSYAPTYTPPSSNIEETQESDKKEKKKGFSIIHVFLLIILIFIVAAVVGFLVFYLTWY